MSHSRRAFIRNASYTAALSVLRADPLNKQPGLQLYTVGEELGHDFHGTLKQIAAIGYKEVELAATYGKSAVELRTAFSDNGLHCRSAHWFDFQKTPDQFMDFASELGVTYIVTSFNPPPAAMAAVSAGSPPDFSAFLKVLENMTLDDYKQSAETCNKLGEAAKKKGLVYAYHNHNLEFKKLGDTVPFDLLLKSTDPELVKLEMDCGWVSVSGHNPVGYLEQYPDRIKLLHIKDFKPGPPNVKLGPSGPEPTELGHGSIDYKQIFASAKKAKIDQYYVEQEPPFKDMPALQAIKVDYDYVHALA